MVSNFLSGSGIYFFLLNGFLLFIHFPALHSAELEFEFINQFDQSIQKAVGFIPDEYDDQSATPVLIIAHYMGGNRFTAKRQGYYEACRERNWLLVCPELHGKRSGGETSLAALEAQYDILGSLHYMQNNYHVDTSRIYIAGRSMGGMLTQIMAAKNPDLFAAAVAGQGISDLREWMDTTIPRIREMALPEIGAYSEENHFEFSRRSSLNYARNFRYIPLVMWHGTNDHWVPPEQSMKLQKAIKSYYPFQPDVFWLLAAAHAPQNYTAEWVCERLEYYQNVPELGMDLPHRFYPHLDLITDEEKRFFWLLIKPGTEGFAEVNVTLTDGKISIKTTNVTELHVDLNLIPTEFHPDSYQVLDDSGFTLAFYEGSRLVKSVRVLDNKSGELPELSVQK